MNVIPPPPNCTQIRAITYTYYAIDNSGQVIETNTIPGQLSPQQQAAISLPASLFNNVPSDSIGFGDSIGMFFGYYENATLFPVGGASRTDSSTSAPRQPQVCSHVLSATVGQNVVLRGLSPEESVMLTFRLEDKLPGVVSL